MEKKEPIKISLSTFFLLLAIIVIIVMGMFIYKLSKEKDEEIQKFNQLKEQITTENSISSEINNNTIVQNEDKNVNKTPSTIVQEKEYEDIILDGNYALPNSDIGWDFTKDGKAASSTSLVISQGTYKTIAKNTIEIHYTKKKEWDDALDGKVTISTIDTYDKVYIDENKNVYIVDANGKQTKLQRFGEAVIENFE